MAAGLDGQGLGRASPHDLVDVAAFRRDGFLRVASVATPEEVAWIREVYDRLFADRRAWDRGDLFDFAGSDEPGREASVPQLLNPSRYEPRLAETGFRRNAHAIARALLGPRAELVFEHAMLKPAMTGGETTWHQDEAFYAKYTNYRALTVWMPLQDVDRTNGCMEYIAGSHEGPLLAHQRIGRDTRVHGLEADGVDAGRATPVPLPAGGAAVHHCRTLHYAGPNRSAAPRRAYALGFGVRSRAHTLRKDHPWNDGTPTDRQRREAAGHGAAERLIAPLKYAAKAILR